MQGLFELTNRRSMESLRGWRRLIWCNKIRLNPQPFGVKVTLCLEEVTKIGSRIEALERSVNFALGGMFFCIPIDA